MKLFRGMVIANSTQPKSNLGEAEEALGGLRTHRLLPLILFELGALDAPGSFFMFAMVLRGILPRARCPRVKGLELDDGDTR